MNLTIVFKNFSHNVHTVQMLLFFQVDLNVCKSVISLIHKLSVYIPQRFGFLEQFSRLTLQSVTYTSECWTAPASGVWLSGELELKQNVPLPASGTVNDYDISPVNISGFGGLEITNILSRYNERNGECVNFYTVLVLHTAEPPDGNHWLEVAFIISRTLLYECHGSLSTFVIK